MAEECTKYSISKESNGKFYGELAHLTYKSSGEAVKTLYDEWAKCYEADIEDQGYAGAICVAKQVIDLCHEQNYPTSIRIIDLGAGTGILAKLLKEHNLTNLDAMDISAKMLKVAEDQGLYKNYFCEGLGLGKLPIDDNTYDIATAAGCFGRGHISPSGLDEAVHIVKRGGFIIWTIRVDYYNDPESGFAAKVEDLTERKIWLVHEKRQVDYHLNVPESNGLRYCFLFVCKKI